MGVSRCTLIGTLPSGRKLVMRRLETAGEMMMSDLLSVVVYGAVRGHFEAVFTESKSAARLLIILQRRRTADASPSDLDGLSDQLQSVSLAISAAMDRGNSNETHDREASVTGMEELRRWYQTEVFAVSDAQQHRWEERRWAFLGQLQCASEQYSRYYPNQRTL